MTNTTHRHRTSARPQPRSSGSSRARPKRIGNDLLRAGWPLLAWAGLVACLAGCGPLGIDQAPTETSSGTTPSAHEGSEDVALVLEGREVTVGEVHAWMQEQFIEEFLKQSDAQIYEMHEKAVRDLVQRHVIDQAAAERSVTPEALFEQVTGEVPEPTLEDVTEWYSINQSRLRGARLEDVGSQIKDMLASERRAQAWAEFVKPRIDALEWELVLEPPRQQLSATRLARGPADAAITLISFSDYQCPYCIRSEPVLEEVLDRYPEDVRLIHRHFPLDSIHPFARPASEAAMCAEEQGKFWEYHDAIFARQGNLDASTLSGIGEELELDAEALSLCIAERRYADFVQADFLAGQEAGVTGTPAFFVNGIPLKGARDADDLSQVIDSELKRLRSN